nr:hypothetical protein CFP56_28706 [Quercus suber]
MRHGIVRVCSSASKRTRKPSHQVLFSSATIRNVYVGPHLCARGRSPGRADAVEPHDHPTYGYLRRPRGRQQGSACVQQWSQPNAYVSTLERLHRVIPMHSMIFIFEDGQRG